MAWADLTPPSRPDFASVNISEDGWQELTAILADAGIRAEAGVWSVADAEATRELRAVSRLAPDPGRGRRCHLGRRDHSGG